MTAPRAWEQRRPQSPDRPPPRRGGHASPYTYAASANGRPAGLARPRVARRSLIGCARALAVAALLALSCALALPAVAQTAPAAPTDFTAAVGNAQVTLSWDTPPTGVTGHEFRYKTGNGAYPMTFTPIEMSGVGGTNQKSFTVTGLTNEVVHTFQLRAVNAGGESTAADADPVTPTPGICDRTQEVQDAILGSTGVENCGAVTVAELAGVTALNISLITGYSGIGELKSGDLAGLTGLQALQLSNHLFTTLPSDVFSGLTSLTILDLQNNELSSLPVNVFSGLTSLTTLNLQNNDLTAVPGVSGLSALTMLGLSGNKLASLPSNAFTGPTSLEELSLNANKLTALPRDVFSGLTALRVLYLHDNDLTALPDGLFSGLTELTLMSLASNPNTGDVLPLTVTVEKFGTDQARAKVLAGAPFAVNFTATVANGSLAGGATKLRVATGSVDGTPVTVTRTAGTTAAVTVDVDLTTQPSLPTGHAGYEFKKAASGLPVEIPEAMETTTPPPQTTNFYLWRTTLTVGESSGALGYTDSYGEISTGAKFNYAPWSPPRKHHFDPDYQFTVAGLYVYESSGVKFLTLGINDAPTIAAIADPGNVTLWIRNTAFRLKEGGGTASGIVFSSLTGHDLSVPDLNWEEDDEVRVALVYERRLPSAPTNVRVTAPPGEDGTLEVSWEEPEFEGTFPIECYLVEFRHPSGEAKKRKQSYPGSLGPGKGCGDSPPTSVRRTDLDTGVQYQVLVQALSGDGYSEWSETKTAHARARSLRAWFESPPERHDGKKRVTVQVAFSEPIDGTPETVGEHGVDVEGGRVTSVRPVVGNAPGGAGNRSAGGRNAGREDREVVWEFEIEPDSDGDVTVSLDAGRPCDEPGAICTADGRSLSEGIATTVEGPDTGPAGLTAAFEGMPEAHDGEGGFRFRVAFSENIGISYRSLREDAFTVTGGRVTGGRRVDGRRDLFEMTVRPDGDGDVTIALPAGRACGVSGAICTKSRPRRQLTNAPAATVAGPGAAALTARFVDMPAEHDGQTAFTLRLEFSETIRMSGRRLRGDVVAVAGGRATKARRVNKRKDLWRLTVKPDSLADVTVTLAGGAACDTPEAVCTKGEPRRKLTNTISTTVLGPAALSVADARAEEGSDETIDFAVSLSREAHASVTVDYTTAAGSATAGEDYTRTSGTLSFAPGETEKTVAVPVLDDAIDEGEETFTLRLSDATGAVIADGTATGTIENSDPLQKMWLSRFGRTVAGQVVDAVAGRLSGPTGGSQVTLGGQSIDLSSLSADTGDARRTLAGALGAARVTNDDGPLAGPGAWETARAGAWEDPETGGTVRSMTGRELLLGSSFHLAAGGGEAGGPGYAAWGRVAVGGFDAEAPAEKGTVRLDGEVTTGILGADAEWERWLAGVALSVSEGEGTFDQPGVDSGTVESTLTSVNPYVRYEASDRLSVWGLVGYGTGDMTMTQAARGERAEIVTRTDLMLRLGAAGARGVLLEAGEDGGIDLALRGDAFLVQMESEAAANTVETKTDASRLRLVLEAGRSFALGEGAVLTPALELGLRHDGGDAETGTGVEVGGRIRYSDTGSGLTVEANARTLVAHEDSGYREWGAGGSVRLDPGASGRGLSLTLAPVWGTPSSGVDRLWSARDAAGLVRDDDFDAERRLEGEIGYGFGAFGGRGVVTPYAGLGLAEAGDRTWRAGARWSLAPHLAMSLDGTRREPANDDAPEHAGLFRLILRW